MYLLEWMGMKNSLRERDGNGNEVDGNGMGMAKKSMGTVGNGNEIEGTGWEWERISIPVL